MKLNIFGAKRQAAGLSASAKANSNKSAKGAEAPADEDVDASEDEDETGAEGDEDETEASSDDEHTDAEGDDEDSDAEGETEASEEDEDVDASVDDEDGDEPAPVDKKGSKKGAEKGASASADTSERQRIANIIDSREGNALPNLAKAFAFQSGMSSASAIKFMGAALKDLGGEGKAPTGKRGAAFRDAMSGQNPKATGFGGGKGNASGGEDGDRVAGLVAAAAKMGFTAPSKS